MAEIDKAASAGTGAGAAFTASLRTADDGAVVAVSGEIDLASADEFRRVVAEGLDRAAGRLVIDLAGVQLLTSAGLSVLAEMHEKARGAQRELVVRTAGAPRIVDQAVKAVGLDQVLPVEDEAGA